jgi:hypothetical protein
MSTTSLFVELLVIGAGAAIWVVLLTLAFFGVDWLPAGGSKDLALPMLLPALSVTYVLGILVDRLADRVLDGQADRLRAKRFSSREDYRHARTLIYTQSESLKELFEYGRSRLRICRGWTVNAAVIVIALVVLGLRTDGWPGLQQPIVWIGGAASALLGWWAWWTWRGLTIGEYTLLYEQRSFLRDAGGPGAPPSGFQQGPRKR